MVDIPSRSRLLFVGLLCPCSCDPESYTGSICCARVVGMSRLRCRGFHFAGLVAVLSVSLLFAQRMVGLEPKKPDPIAGATKVQERWVDRTLRHLTLEEKIGQMIEVRGIMGYYNANDPGFEKLIADIRKYHLGAVHLTVNTDGPLLVRTQAYEAAMTVRRLQQEIHEKVSLIVSVDIERGP